jgi:hypothetical protein
MQTVADIKKDVWITVFALRNKDWISLEIY